MKIQPSSPPIATPHTSHSHGSGNLMSFHDFLENHQSPWTNVFLYLWYAFIAICAVILKYLQLDISQNISNSPLTMLRFLGFIPILLHSYHYIQQRYYPSWKSQPFRIYQIGNMFLLIVTFLSSSALLVTSLSSKCQYASCVTIESRQLQPFVFLQHILIPVIAPVLLKAHSPWSSYFTYIMSFSVSVLSAIIVNATLPTYLSIAALYLFELLVVYDNEATLRQLYINYINAEEHLRMKLKTFHERDLLLLHGEELSSFYGNVAHDLKSPLQGFIIELDTLEKHLNDSSSNVIVGESIVVLRSICNFMLMTINRAIDYSKATYGIVLVPILESVNISDAIIWVVKCVSPLNDTTIKVEPLPDILCPTVVTDKHWLMENLLCLVSNALKFTIDEAVIIRCLLVPKVNENTSPKPQSSPETQTSAMVVLLEVEDSGSDANVHDLARVFQPYNQSQRPQGGTGLGLYSILKRVEALGGNCGVKSRRDGAKGSRFWFSFPYQPEQSYPPPSRQYDIHDIRSVSPTASDLHHEKVDEEAPKEDEKKKILLVEDSVLIQKTTSRALQKAGYQVDIARNGLECLEMIITTYYEFILMDIQMPIMDGIEATKQIRKLETEKISDTIVKQDVEHEFEDIRSSSRHHIIIGLSANSDPITMQEALDAGMDAFLPKPLSTNLLQETFHRLTHS